MRILRFLSRHRRDLQSSRSAVSASQKYNKAFIFLLGGGAHHRIGTAYKNGGSMAVIYTIMLQIFYSDITRKPAPTWTLIDFAINTSKVVRLFNLNSTESVIENYLKKNSSCQLNSFAGTGNKVGEHTEKKENLKSAVGIMSFCHKNWIDRE